MKAMPLIGFTIPTCNDAGTLARCLESVLSQDYDNLMVGALDNQSTDESYDILVDFEKHYRKRLYIGRTFARLGPVDHRNRAGGLLNPRVRIFQHLAPTDVLPPAYTSCCQELFASDDRIGLVSTHADVIHPSGFIEPAVPYRPASCVLPGATQMESFMADGLRLNTLNMYRGEVYHLSHTEGFIFNRFPLWLPLVMGVSISDQGYIAGPPALRGDPEAILGDQYIPDIKDVLEHYLFLQAFHTIALRLHRPGVAAHLPRAIDRLSSDCIRSAQLLQNKGDEQSAKGFLSLALAYLPEVTTRPAFRLVASSFKDQPLDWQ
jgi:hypothetical protein